VILRTAACTHGSRWPYPHSFKPMESVTLFVCLTFLPAVRSSIARLALCPGRRSYWTAVQSAVLPWLGGKTKESWAFVLTVNWRGGMFPR
jgi:hypothetical protein